MNAVMMLHLLALLAMTQVSIRAPLEVQDLFSVDSRNTVPTELAELYAMIWSTMCAVMINSTTPMTDLPPVLQPLRPLPLLLLPLPLQLPHPHLLHLVL